MQILISKGPNVCHIFKMRKTECLRRNWVVEQYFTGHCAVSVFLYLAYNLLALLCSVFRVALPWRSLPFHGFFDAPNPIARPQAQWQSDHPFFSLAEAPPWTSALLLIPRLAPPFTQQAAIQHAHRRRQQQQEPSRGIFLPYSSWVMSPFRRTMLASSVLFCSYWIVLASSGSGTGNAWCT